MEPDFVLGAAAGNSRQHDMSEKLLGDATSNFLNDQEDGLFLLEGDTEEEEDKVIRSASRQSRTSSTAGEKQPQAYRDVWAAILFVTTLIILLFLAFGWGIPALHYHSSSTSSSISFTGLLLLTVTCSFAALLISGLGLTVLMRAASQLIQISLLLTVLSEAVVTVILVSQHLWWGAIISVLFLALSVWYATAVWRRIPFAAANLQTALCAVQANAGLIVVGYGISVTVNVIFSIVWLLAWLGVYVRSADCGTSTNNSGNDECISHMHPIVLCGFLLCYYWVTEVGKNVLTVTTAGVVGTFWFVPDQAGTFCSPAVTDSLVRACTFSAGSICLGSLLTALLQLLHSLADQARRHGHRGNDLILCVLECLVGFLERLVAYFNKWAYVYIGLYGYDYLTAGKKVMALFMERGWTTIITDNLVMRVLGLVSLVIGGLTGCVGLLLASARPGWVDEFGGGSSTVIAFSIPALIGTSMAYILMSVVAAAVDTVIVAFCEAPLEFERNHPGLHAHMSSAWRQVYPEEFGR